MSHGNSPERLAKDDGGHAHQFDDASQQRNAAILGMWTFLCTEVLFFGAVFVAYTVYRYRYPHAFYLGATRLKFWYGAVNTAVLLCSSLTMALAVHAAAAGRRRSTVRFLIFTMILGVTFLCIKALEYHAEWEDGLVPHYHFNAAQFTAPPGPSQIVPAPDYAANVELFFCFYFIMTGLHALHMVVGIGIMAILVAMALRGRFSARYYTPVEVSGLYWHFVDIVWVFLFPLLYLLIQFD